MHDYKLQSNRNPDRIVGGSSVLVAFTFDAASILLIVKSSSGNIRNKCRCRYSFPSQASVYKYDAAG
jgi:hypothetical protein